MVVGVDLVTIGIGWLLVWAVVCVLREWLELSRGRLEVVTQMRKECPLFCVLICSPGLPLIVASRPAKSAIDIRAVMYHDGRGMDGERAR